MEYLKCNLCGNVATLLVNNGAQIVCCGAKMGKMDANTVDASTEKHVPVISTNDTEVTVTVGEVIHPNDQAHHVSFIALRTDKGVQYKTPAIDSQPVAKFKVLDDERIISAYEYCNLHGLWKKDFNN